jgi:adenosylcobinamide-GDP ribazoletransferase
LRGLRAATSFLTRIPVGTAPAEEPDVARSIAWFPVVGGLLGAAAAGAYAVARLILPPPVAATLAVGAVVALTGAFHEDGLADTADAFGAWSKEEALRIMKDPAHGTNGVVILAISLLLRVGALGTLDRWSALVVLPAAHALSRAAAVGLLGSFEPATNEGLGASYASIVTGRRMAAAISVGLVLAVASIGLWALPASLLAGLGAWLVGYVAVRKIGGVTGDVLGAAQQVAEILVLLLGAAAVTKGWPLLAWWR